MADPTEFTWIDTIIHQNGAAASALTTLMWDMKRLLEALDDPSQSSIITYLQTSLQTGSTNLQRLPECLMLLRAYTVSHNGDPTDFGYPDPFWWNIYIPATDPNNPAAPKLVNFACYSRPVMENFVAVFPSELSMIPSFWHVTWKMDITQISLSGLRFKASTLPEKWILATHTQPHP